MTLESLSFSEQPHGQPRLWPEDAGSCGGALWALPSLPWVGLKPLPDLETSWGRHPETAGLGNGTVWEGTPEVLVKISIGFWGSERWAQWGPGESSGGRVRAPLSTPPKYAGLYWGPSTSATLCRRHCNAGIACLLPGAGLSTQHTAGHVNE